MSLWSLFPDLLPLIGTGNWAYSLYVMPALAVVLYFGLAVRSIVSPQHRFLLLGFIALSIASSVIIVTGDRPRGDDILKPLGLLLVMLFPLIQIGLLIYKKHYQHLTLWLVVLAAGICHSMGWFTFISALARS